MALPRTFRTARLITIRAYLGLVVASVLLPTQLAAAQSTFSLQSIDVTDGVYENRVEVTWTATNTDPRSTFEVYRDGELLTVLASTVRSYLDFSGKPGQMYEYCVLERDVETFAWDPICAEGRRILFAPTQVSASDGQFDEHVEIRWSDRSEIETGYRIYRRAAGSSATLQAIGTAPVNYDVYRDESAVPGTQYEYCVAAIQGSFESAHACDLGERGFVLPPLNVAASDGQYPDRVHVTWVDQSGGSAPFRIYRRTNGSNASYDQVGTTLAGAVSYDDLTAQNGATYEYCAAAISGSGAESVRVCDAGGRGTLAPPQDVTATQGTYDDRAVISWSISAATEDGFRVYRRAANASDSTLVTTTQAGATKFEDKDAAPGQAYRYCVVAFTNLGAASAPACSNGLRADVLAPINVTATKSEFEDRVEITWESQATRAVMFKVYADGFLIKTLPTTQTWHADPDLPSGQVQQYCVTAVTALDVSSDSACDTGSRRMKPPSNVAATMNAHEDRVVLTWSDNSQVEEGYRIYRRRVNESEFTELTERDPNRTIFNDESGEPGVEYVYRIAAFDFWGESEAVEVQGQRTLAAPTNVVATKGASEKTVEITWTDNSSAETGYLVERAEVGSNDFMFVLTPGPNQISAVDFPPKFGTSYVYRVRTMDDQGYSDAATDTGYTAILPPASVNASTGYPNRVVITWVDQSQVEDRYVVYRDGDSLNAAPMNGTTWTDLTAQPGVTHQYCVEAVSGAARSAQVCARGGIPGSGISENHLLFSDPVAAGAFFGVSVASDGEWAAGGAHRENNDNGAVYVFRRTGHEWKQVQRLTNPTPGPAGAQSFFGRSVSLSGDLLVVGAPREDVAGHFDTGAAHGYRLIDETWVYVDHLSQFDLTGWTNNEDLFGQSVAVDGKWLIVGAPRTEISGEELGTVSIYEFDRTTDEWVPIEYFFGSRTRSFLGWSVATKDGMFVAGAPSDMLNTPAPTNGRVHFYFIDDSGSDPDVYPGAEMESPRDRVGDRFGVSVAIGDGFVVVGASESVNGTHGEAFVHEYTEKWSDESSFLTNGERLELPTINRFGTTVAGGSGIIVVGGFGSSELHLFRKQGSAWMPSRVYKDPNGTFVGTSLALHGDWLLAGAVEYTGTGAVHKIPLISAPSGVAAGDGSNARRIDLSWTDESGNEDGFRIYRNGTLITTTAANARSYQDTDAPAGAGYEYCIAAYSQILGESGQVCDYGWRPPDGAMNGRIATYSGAGVDGVEVCLDPVPGRSLLLDGDGGTVVVQNGNDGSFAIGKSFTVEAWIRPTSLSGRHVIFSTRGSNQPGSFQLEVGTGSNGTGRVAVSGPNTWIAETGNNVIQLNTWTHIAYVHNESAGTKHAIYVNGERMTISSTPYAFADNADEKIVGGPNYKGQIDQLRVWTFPRTQVQVQEVMHTPLSGDVEGLAANWSFDVLANGAVMDLTSNGRHGVLKDGAYPANDTPPLDVCAITDLEGNFTIPGIQYGTSTTFRVTPVLGPHRFEPAHKSITLSPENPVQNEITFTDASSFTLSGTVRYEGVPCFPEGVEILVDGAVRGTTDNQGRFSIAAEFGDRVIEARYLDHTFLPAKMEVTVEGDQAGLEFVNNTYRKLRINVGGGCGISIGDADVKIFTENDCFSQTITADGAYELTLPPQSYLVQVSDVQTPSGIDKADVLRFYEQKGAVEIDLSEDDLELDLTYRAPLVVDIEGLPAASCPSLHVNGKPLPSVPILEQGPSPIPLTVLVNEDYGVNGLCPVDTGRVTIYDEIADAEDAPVTLTIENGQVQYETFANTPNVAAGRKDAQGIDRSYQKSITAIVEVPDKEAVNAAEWVVVTGDRPRAGTFVSATSEEIPLLILRDPPGDQSSSYLESGTRVCNTLSDLMLESASLGLEAEVKVGIELFKGLGVMSRTEAALIGGTRFEFGLEATQSGGMEICATTTERFSTSSDPDFVGSDGDVYLGTALNFVFAKSDVVEVEGCNIVLSETLRMGADGFETTYLYTQAHIRDAIIPQLEDLAALNEEMRDYFLVSRDNWKDHLALNDRLKQDAKLVRNRSFSAGANYDYSHTVDTVTTQAWETRVYTGNEAALGFMFNESGNEGSAKFFTTLGFSATRSGSTSESTSRTVGYTLSDGDAGDYFTLDVKDDPAYGTPVFSLVDGRSSCPYEPGTQPRDAPALNISPAALVDVDPERPATFTLALTNLSDSEETRTYTLMPLQTRNPGGAVMTAGGNTFAQGQDYTIGPNQTQEVTLAVERGPSRFRYDSLAVVLQSSCDAGIADTLYFDVRFSAPCSEISLFRPRSGWTYTRADRDASKPVEIILDDFILEEPDAVLVKSIGAEYRRKGTAEWLPIEEVDAADLTPGMSYSIDWDVIGRGIPDGVYEIRAFTRCDAGLNYSLIAEGTIDTAPPVVFGKPQPSDGILTMGEDIRVTFNEPIRCSVLNPANASLVDENGAAVPFDLACNGSSLILTPTPSDPGQLEGTVLTASVDGVRDVVDNLLEAPITWSFEVRQSLFTWTSIVDALEVPFSNPGSIPKTLANGTSAAASFTITEHPSWLTPGETDGSLPPGGTKIIDFAIQQDLPIGQYAGQVLAESDQGNAVFDLTVDVVCAPPVWEVEAAAFQYSMTLVGRVFANGAPNSTPGTRVAAFVGNELRGVGEVEVAGALGPLVFMTLYSNRDRGETLRFEIYEPDTCVRYPATQERYAFQAELTRGSTQNPVTLTGLSKLASSVQSIEVREGWTWFSTNLTAADMSVGNVLSNTTPANGDLIKSQTAYQQFDLEAGWVGSLQTIDVTKSYMVKLSAPGAILYEGDPVDVGGTPIPIHANWNWIGYTPQAALPIETALQSYPASDGDVIKSQTAFAQFVAGGSDAGWYGNLEMLEPGKGYKLYATSPTVAEFHYPNAASSPGLAASVIGKSVASVEGLAGEATESHRALPEEWQLEPGNFPENMTITAVLQGLEAGESARIGAFAEDGIRGVGEPVSLPGRDESFLFLVIHGAQNDAAELTLRLLTDENEPIDLLETMNFSPDARVGTVAEPHVLDVAAAVRAATIPDGFSLSASYPNPFNERATIQYGLPEDVHVRMVVYDLLGREVMRLVDEPVRAGQHEVVVDAARLASGVYFYRLTAGSFTNSRRMVVVR